MAGDDRADREREFHDALYTRRARASVDAYYALLMSSAEFYTESIQAECRDKHVLEFGCGEGSLAISLALRGAVVDAIDISPVAIDVARASAVSQQASVGFRLMNAERLEYGDDAFDLICGRSILHHVNLDRALAEIGRTLRTEGKAVFLEPLGHNMILNLARRLTPGLRSPDERPLLMPDIRTAGQHFGSVRARYFHLSSLLALPFRRVPGVGFLMTLLDFTDRLLFATWLRKYAWIVVLTLEHPEKPQRGSGSAGNESSPDSIATGSRRGSSSRRCRRAQRWSTLGGKVGSAGPIE